MSSKSRNLAKLRAAAERKEMLQLLHERFQPHPGQIKVGKQLFLYDRKVMMVQCGRNWGKSVFACYSAARWALTHPKSRVYIVGPTLKDETEIVWASGELRDKIPDKYIAGKPNNAERRLTLTNGSFIKVEGADNPDSLRGIKGHLFILDEFKDWKGEAHRNLRENTLAFDAPQLIVGTPPDNECYYTFFRKFVLDEIASTNRRYFYMEQDTFQNPKFASRKEELKREFELAGETQVFEREYMAKYVPGGALAVFPSYVSRRDEECGVSSECIENEIRRDKKKLDWYCIADPASNTCFAVLFVCINRYTKTLYILDEIYERDRNHTSTTKIWPRIEQKMQALFSGQWSVISDSHEAWFVNEVRDTFRETVIPVVKRADAKTAQISIIKTAINTPGKFKVALDRCKFFDWEMANYITKDDGSLIKRNDHLLDCLRYLIDFSGYKVVEEKDPLLDYDDYRQPRGESLEQMFRRKQSEKDPMHFMSEPEYYYD